MSETGRRMVNDLVVFLRARFDEDEQAALEVRGTWRQSGESGVVVAYGCSPPEECAKGNWQGIAEHIVRHDPSRVLREVNAKRKLLDLLERENVLALDNDQWTWEDREPIDLLALVYADHADYPEMWRY